MRVSKHMPHIVWFLLIASRLLADEGDLFTDESDGFPTVPFEVDPDFQDDFAHIEMGPGMDTDGFRPGLVITDSHHLFSQRDLERREKSISLLGGNETIASTYHFLLNPQARFQAGPVFGHLGVPLRFAVYDNGSNGAQGQRSKGFVDIKKFIVPRQRDFRDFWDLQRGIRHFEINRERDAHFMRLSRSHALTLGQGELVKGMVPDGFYDQDLLFLSGHTQFEAVHINAFVGPLFKASILGVSSRFTPLSMVPAPALVRDINFEITYVNDFKAPHHAAQAEGAYILDDDRRSVKRDTGTAQGAVLGIANEFYPVSWLGLKPYISWGHLWLTGLANKDGEQPSTYGGGLHVGHDASFEFLPNKRSVLLFKSEGRLFSQHYYPGYFGSTYLIDRQVFNEPHNTAISKEPVTKSQYLSSGGDQRFRVGYLFELGYAYEDAVASMLSYENAHSFAQGVQIAPLRKLQLITSVLALDALKLYVGYQATSLEQMRELFDFDKSRALLSLRGQLKLMPFVYFDAWMKHSFGIHDMFTKSDANGDAEPLWLSSSAETRSLNFGLGLEFAMTF